MPSNLRVQRETTNRKRCESSICFRGRDGGTAGSKSVRGGRPSRSLCPSRGNSPPQRASAPLPAAAAAEFPREIEFRTGRVHFSIRTHARNNNVRKNTTRKLCPLVVDVPEARLTWRCVFTNGFFAGTARFLFFFSFTARSGEEGVGKPLSNVLFGFCFSSFSFRESPRSNRRLDRPHVAAEFPRYTYASFQLFPRIFRERT